MEDICENCYYFDGNVCKFHAPVYSEKYQEGQFPSVWEGNFCSHFKTKPLDKTN